MQFQTKDFRKTFNFARFTSGLIMAKRMTRNSNLCCKKKRERSTDANLKTVCANFLTNFCAQTFSQITIGILTSKMESWLRSKILTLAVHKSLVSDQTIDQTLNRHTKISGDIIGVSLRPAVQKWMLTANVHHRAALIHSCQEHASVDHSSGHPHKDWHMTRLRADKMMVQEVTWLAQPLIHILKRQTWLLSGLGPRSLQQS